MKFIRKFTALFRNEKIEADIAEEMRLHLERRAEENLASGRSAEEVRYAALRKFGGVEQLKKVARGQRSAVWQELGFSDVRFSLHSLAKSPGFSVVALLTLALAIGARTSMFTLLRGGSIPSHWLQPR